MFLSEKNALFSAMTQDSNIEGDSIESTIDVMDFKEGMLEMLRNQLDNVNPIRVDVINQIDQIQNVERRYQALEEAFNYLTSYFGFELDAYSIKNDYQTLLETTRYLYQVSFYNSIDLLSKFTIALFESNPTFSNSLYTSLTTSEDKKEYKKLDKNLSEDISENTKKQFFFLNKVFKDYESFELVFRNEALYEVSTEETSSLVTNLFMQPSEVLCKLFKHNVFNNSLQLSIFVNNVKNLILLSGGK